MIGLASASAILLLVRFWLYDYFKKKNSKVSLVGICSNLVALLTVKRTKWVLRIFIFIKQRDAEELEKVY